MLPLTPGVKLKLDKYGFDSEIELYEHEAKCCEAIIKGSSLKDAWIEHVSRFSRRDPNHYTQAAHQWSKQPNVAIYLQYLKAGLYDRITLNSELIAKKLAVQLNTSLADFVDENGNRKRLGEVNTLALAGCKVKMKFSSEGEPIGATEIELPSSIDVINGLVRLAEVDADLVATLKAKLEKQKIKLKRGQ